MLFLSLSSSTSCFHRLTVTNCEMPRQNKFTETVGEASNEVTNLRSGVPYIFCRGGKVRLIQLLEYLSVASPESGLFSDWSRNKKVLRTEP